LADHPEICSRHDRAMAAAAVAALPSENAATSVIVDIGLPTLESGEAAKIAAEMASAGHTVGFRPLGLDMTAKRSAAVRQVYELLKNGIPVWLPNFSAAISKSRQLKGAYVEVSATFLRDISAHSDRNKLLSGLLKVWHDVEVRLVAVNVDSKNLAAFVNKLGIAYGIGIAADPAADAPQSSRDA
jgi:EAL domain-containing protein (putative c-di-GMP-specific phosphodiesterase class I)